MSGPMCFQVPIERGWFYTVRIFRTRPQMYKFREAQANAGVVRAHGSKDYLAICSTTPGRNQQFGEILFTLASVSRIEIVVHELVHAAHFWLDARGIEHKTEAVAALVENLLKSYLRGVARIARKAVKTGRYVA